MKFDRKAHWERVYKLKPPDTVSWYQAKPTVSLELMRETHLPRDAAVIDVGGGASVLVDHLTSEGSTNLTVLDISGAALDLAKERLGEAANNVTWVENDVTKFDAPQNYSLWHDRAVFHFLTDKAERDSYIRALQTSLASGGYFIVATFAKDGPTRCSGLDIVRYDEAIMTAELGNAFELVESRHEVHLTPSNTEQNFQYFLFRKT